MAKKHNKNAKKKKKVNQSTKPKVSQEIKPKAVQKKSTTGNQANTKKGPTRNEIMFFKIGIAVIAIGLVVAAIVMIVSYFMNKEEVNPYIDYNHLETEEIVAMTKYINDTTYGDLDYFQGKDQYEDLRVILSQNDVFYFYFYSSSSINEEIKAEIDKLDSVENLPILFVDLEAAENLTLFEDANLTHLNLDTDQDDMLLIYDMQPDNIDEFFELQTNVLDIIATIEGNL